MKTSKVGVKEKEASERHEQEFVRDTKRQRARQREHLRVKGNLKDREQKRGRD